MNRIPELIKELETLASHHLEIGIMGEDDTELTMIAAVHEFGVDIQVTPKMRAFLHTIGIHLKKETEVIRIPERSYIRAGWDSKLPDIEKKITMLLDGVLMGQITAMMFFEGLGPQIEAYLREYLVALSTPPLKPATIARKGSSNPLVDTGRLKGAITWRVV